MTKLDPYPWVSPGGNNIRWGSEYPAYDGMPLTHLNLVFQPEADCSQDINDYPEKRWTNEDLWYARGYHAGYDRAVEDAADTN